MTKLEQRIQDTYHLFDQFDHLGAGDSEPRYHLSNVIRWATDQDKTDAEVDGILPKTAGEWELFSTMPKAKDAAVFLTNKVRCLIHYIRVEATFEEIRDWREKNV